MAVFLVFEHQDKATMPVVLHAMPPSANSAIVRAFLMVDSPSRFTRDNLWCCAASRAGISACCAKTRC